MTNLTTKYIKTKEKMIDRERETESEKETENKLIKPPHNLKATRSRDDLLPII